MEDNYEINQENFEFIQDSPQKGLISVLLRTEKKEIQREHDYRYGRFRDKSQEEADELLRQLLDIKNDDVLSRRLQRRFHRYCDKLGISTKDLKNTQTLYSSNSEVERLISIIMNLFGGDEKSEIGKKVLQGKINEIEPHEIAPITPAYYDALYSVQKNLGKTRPFTPENEEYKRIKNLLDIHRAATGNAHNTCLEQCFPETFEFTRTILRTRPLLDPTATEAFLNCLNEDINDQWRTLISDYAKVKLDHFTKVNHLTEQYRCYGDEQLSAYIVSDIYDVVKANVLVKSLQWKMIKDDYKASSEFEYLDEFD